MRTAIIVPARLASVRFPRKLLFPVRGRPLILWTALRLRQQAPEFDTWFAVDGPELQKILEDNGFRTVLTDPDLPSGTDRLAVANETVGADAVINVQADEPLVTAGHLRTLARLIAGEADMATLSTRFTSGADFLDPNKVKVVTGTEGRALYFSRAPIPFPRDLKGVPDQAFLDTHARLHLGMYAYKAKFLKDFGKLAPGRLEMVEKLEQLRALENGKTIAVGETDETTVGIDVPEDAARFEKALLAAGL